MTEANESPQKTDTIALACHAIIDGHIASLKNSLNRIYGGLAEEIEADRRGFEMLRKMASGEVDSSILSRLLDSNDWYCFVLPGEAVSDLVAADGSPIIEAAKAICPEWPWAEVLKR